MKGVLGVLALLAAACALVPSAAAGGPNVANGGGNGTFDGVNSGSHFGFGVVYGGSVKGHFECNMAGNSAFDGLHLMAVEGTVTSGSVDVASGMATFRGTATLHVDADKSTIGFAVEIHEGGSQVGWLHLTVYGSPFGPVFTFPLERVLTGQIGIH
jgi:hypothetical protein